jgi:hypothetical protein
MLHQSYVSEDNMIPSLSFTPEQRIKELDQQLAETGGKEKVVKIMNTEFGTTLTKKQLAALSRKHKHPD